MGKKKVAYYQHIISTYKGKDQIKCYKYQQRGRKNLMREHNNRTTVFITSSVEPFDSKLCVYITVIKIKAKELRKEGGNTHQPWNVREKESQAKKKKKLKIFIKFSLKSPGLFRTDDTALCTLMYILFSAQSIYVQHFKFPTLTQIWQQNTCYHGSKIYEDRCIN